MFWLFLLLACIAVTVAAWAATWAVLRGLIRFRVYDTPNPRSSHAAPTPRGGGLALIAVLLLSWLGAAAWLGTAPEGFPLALVSAVLLAAVSWIDDLKRLSVILRLAAQAGAIILGLIAMDGAGPVFQGFLPPVLDRIAAGILWLWFVNLFNFMDGIDGISGVEAICTALGLVLLAWLLAWPPEAAAFPALLAGATLGFLGWNWPPAKIFLGDVGSVPLGYLLGWLLLLAAMEGQWAVALILPLYYLADASITLIRRGARRAKVWQAHKEHFYQRAVQGGLSHAQVSVRVLVCNIFLIGCATLAALGYIWPALGAAVVFVALLLTILERASRV